MSQAEATPMGKAIDARMFWRALGQRAVGAAIVTAEDIQGPAGFLALSATHLSADPPLMMVSVDRRTSALTAILTARHFAINYLPEGAQALADTFGGKSPLKGAERFQPEIWSKLATGAPILVDAVGALDCALEETIERAGVVIAIGRLVDFAASPDREPLVTFRGGYR